MNRESLEVVLKNKINPILRVHDGFAIIVGDEWVNNKLLIVLEFHGGCFGCPLSFSGTLRMIEDIFKKELEMENIEVANIEML